jgi:hypothetical protein
VEGAFDGSVHHLAAGAEVRAVVRAVGVTDARPPVRVPEGDQRATEIVQADELARAQLAAAQHGIPPYGTGGMG